MATALPAPIVAKALPGSRFDHLFFSAASVLVLISVLIGFAPTCFLVGVFRATFQIPLFISTAPYIPAGSFSWFSKLVWSPLIASTSIAASGCSASPLPALWRFRQDDGNQEPSRQVSCRNLSPVLAITCHR